MNAVTRAIRLLVAVAIFNCVSCQDGFSEQDLLRLQQLSSSNNDGQVETITSYSTNIMQRDPVRNEHSLSSVNVQFHLTEDVDKTNHLNQEYHRANQGRSDRRKVFHIKNPFQRQLEQNERQEELMDDITGSQPDSNSGASNQYASMQYSLPPDEFLQKMRAENQYLQQVSTPSPLLSYTATPLPSYQYSTPGTNNYDNQHQQQQQQQQQQQLQQQQQQTNQINQIEQKITHSHYQPQHPGYQFISGYSFDNVQSSSTPVPPFLSTANNQLAGTSSYVSSASPVYLSSQPNIQQYVSSPISVVQTGSPDYSNTLSTASNANTIGYDPNSQNKRMQIDHYDNAANGMRYPINVQQYAQDNPSSTPVPSSSSYPDSIHDSWQNVINSGINSLSKSLHDFSLSQYQNSPYNSNQQDSRSDANKEVVNNEMHRIGNIPLDYQQDYSSHNRHRIRDLDQQASQPNIYSNGDYGWKLNDNNKKPAGNANDVYATGSAPTRYETFGYSADGNAVSQMNFYLDSSKNYDPIAKSSTESHEAQEFAKAAAKAHENMKQQQLARLAESYFGHSNYAPAFSNNMIRNSPSNIISTYYGGNEGHKNKLYSDGNHIYNNQMHSDVITASPVFYPNSREITVGIKPKPSSFDHAKALKNIVPIDVSNVIGNESPKYNHLDNSNNRYNIPNYSKDQTEQNYKQMFKPVTESYYKDKNSGYGFNIKIKPEDVTAPESVKPLDQSYQYYSKQSIQETPYGQSAVSDNKRYGETGPAPQHLNYIPQATNNYANSIQPIALSPAPQSISRPQSPVQSPSDITSVLKFNDIPYRLTQGLSSDALRLNNNNFDQNGIPTPIPSRINQNVESHQIDVANHLLNKLMQSKQPLIGSNRPDIDLQTAGLVSNINGFRVANPFNMDMKLVADVLKGKPAVDDSHLYSRDTYNKANPFKLDLSALQSLILKNENNYNSLAGLTDGLTGAGSPYYDIYNSRHPFGGVKYSRSQEEEEHIPIADASNTHPIGAVIEQEDIVETRQGREGADIISTDGASTGFDETRSKTLFNREHKTQGRQRHPNALPGNRNPYLRKIPKDGINEPYPLLKPPPVHSTRGRIAHHHSKMRGSRRRRLNRNKYARVLKAEPLFEAESSVIEQEEENTVPPTLLQPPPPVSEDKSDVIEKEVDVSS